MYNRSYRDNLITFIFIWLHFWSIVNCEWGSWTTGDCSTTCGDGTRTNTRLKTVAEQHNGRCEGSPSMNERCNERPCPSMSLNQILNNFITNGIWGMNYVIDFLLIFSKLRMG